MQIRTIKTLIILTLSFAFNGCQTPHNNPLDPDNPNYKLAILSGQLLTYRVPHIPISNVNLFWKQANISSQTNAQGFFEIDQLQKEDG